MATASAPGRVNLIGEHLDYNGGRCLPFALPQRTRVTALATDDGIGDIQSAGRRWVGPLAERPDNWAAYALGVARRLAPRGARLSISSDVPEGAGLSSSAALLCAAAVALAAEVGEQLTEQQLIDLTTAVETDDVGAPTGGLDHTICVRAQADRLLEIDFASGRTAQHSFSPARLGCELLVINTGVQHHHLTGGYGQRRRECAEASERLGVRHLALAQSWAGLPPPLLRRARHVITENQRVCDFISQLGDPEAMGTLMSASHASLRDDFEVSCRELDLVVMAAISAGAFGARMTGGGFGGSAIALVPLGASDRVRSSVRDVADSFTPEIFSVEPSSAVSLDPTDEDMPSLGGGRSSHGH